jgi:prepilin-type processing-associated H-X9-DG protein
MKVNFSRRKNGALTAFEMLAVVVCIVILAALFLPMLATVKRRASKINCVSNLRQVNIGLQIWASDNSNRYPMAVSVTNGGAMELIDAGQLTQCLQLTSNEMSVTKIFVCPDDPGRTFATNWNDLNNLHVSYFLGADASNDDDSAMILSGDDNLVVGGKPVASGLVNVSSNASLSWFGMRHKSHVNIGFADGSVEEVFTTNDLQWAFQRTGLATNRIAIP